MHSTPLMELTDVRFSWSDGEPPLLDIDHLSIQRGRSLFIKGPSGSGKTTLLNLMGGVLVPQQGKIDILGKSLIGLPGADRDQVRADHVGFIFQLFNLIPYLSVVDNVTLPCRFSRVRKERAFSKGGSEKEEALRLLGHLNMSDFIDTPVTRLSVGQQQRVAAARSLIGSPELIIADEPTSALDYDMRERFLELLFKECESANSTLVFVSHDGSLGERFDEQVDMLSLRKTPIAG